MHTSPRHQFDTTHRNLRRLFLFRSISLALQMLVIFVCLRWLNLPLPVGPLAAIIVTHTLWNGYTAWRAQQTRPVSESELFLQLLTDVLALTGVLYLTGGATNAFVGVYLLPLMITATILPNRFVWGMAGLTIACYSLLMFFNLPLDPSSHMHDNTGFGQHVLGMWFSFVFSAGLVSYFVTNMAQALRDRDRALAATREQSLRDESLVALGTLAAGAAHELGTPLNTMAIVSDELKHDYPAHKDAELNENLVLISEQIQRCKEALSVISASAGERRAEGGKALPVDTYLQDLVHQWKIERPATGLQQNINGAQPAPRLIADLALGQSITNILNNAADASPEWVAINAQWSQESLTLEIRDHGPGFSPNALTHIGKSQYSEKEHGMGMGLFLAHSVIDRSGGDVSFFNEEKGGCVRITLPLLPITTNEHIA